MATRSDFTEEEWKDLQQGVTGSAMLVSVADRSFMDTFGEANAMARYLAAQAAASPSELIRAIASVHGTGFGVTSSPAAVGAETGAALQSSLAVLGQKAPEDVDAYRQLVLGAAQAVAEAKGGVKPDEEEVLATIRQALGIA